MTYRELDIYRVIQKELQIIWKNIEEKLRCIDRFDIVWFELNLVCYFQTSVSPHSLRIGHTSTGTVLLKIVHTIISENFAIARESPCIYRIVVLSRCLWSRVGFLSKYETRVVQYYIISLPMVAPSEWYSIVLNIHFLFTQIWPIIEVYPWRHFHISLFKLSATHNEIHN